LPWDGGRALIAVAKSFRAVAVVRTSLGRKSATEDSPELVAALKRRLTNHPKANRIAMLPEIWIEAAANGKLRFDANTLVVAFVLEMDAAFRIHSHGHCSATGAILSARTGALNHFSFSPSMSA